MNMFDMEEVSLSTVVISGGASLVCASALAYVLLQTRATSTTSKEPIEQEQEKIVAVDKNEYPGGQVTVYFGTQTGTAESFANELEREGPNLGFLVHTVDLEDVTVPQIIEDLRKDAETGAARAVFLVSTYGEGEATDNAAQFVQAMKELNEEEEGKKIFSGELEYCVFGLGNREYDMFNAMGKFFDKGLEDLGAKRILELGLGDDNDDLEGDFESWKDNQLWPTLKKLYLPDESILKQHQKVHPAKGALPDCPFVVEYQQFVNPQQKKTRMDHVHASSRHYFTAEDCPVAAIRELRTQKDPGSTVHLEIDISNANDVTYETADNFGVLPVNDSSIVESVAQSLGYDLDAIFSVRAAPNHDWHGDPFPMPISIRECLARYCDLTICPRRSDLKLLAAYAKHPLDQKALLRMASKEGKQEYREKIVDAHLGLADMLKLCPSIELPLEHFLAYCPRLHPRYYTISSSSSVTPNTVHLTVAVTERTRADGTVFRGVCSNYLATLKPSEGSVVRVFNRPSTFRLPKDPTKAILMIGPGTGVAPMRALLIERKYQRDELKKNVGKSILYFGCKKRSQDYLYQDELEAFQKDGVLSELHLAFSRETKDKVYVQHLLEQNAEETWNLVDRHGAYIYVCGGVKMGGGVADVLKKIISEHGKMTIEDAKEYLSQLATDGRFVQELWA